MCIPFPATGSCAHVTARLCYRRFSDQAADHGTSLAPQHGKAERGMHLIAPNSAAHAEIRLECVTLQNRRNNKEEAFQIFSRRNLIPLSSLLRHMFKHNEIPKAATSSPTEIDEPLEPRTERRCELDSCVTMPSPHTFGPYLGKLFRRTYVVVGTRHHGALCRFRRCPTNRVEIKRFHPPGVKPGDQIQCFNLEGPSTCYWALVLPDGYGKWDFLLLSSGPLGTSTILDVVLSRSHPAYTPGNTVADEGMRRSNLVGVGRSSGPHHGVPSGGDFYTKPT
ncbi:hypothetical protein B0T18DRAFT_37580 [Schizothecium vesticola]|uniref:Uncharacterized protein n=1 Tax=Schizothecium vesticola TaxID=314040 RepID=A0AA40FB01_9PEZI|nr:hypothetical protein B0T18DRAFT_37580 [Schizothecium vesticola]